MTTRAPCHALPTVIVGSNAFLPDHLHALSSSDLRRACTPCYLPRGATDLRIPYLDVCIGLGLKILVLSFHDSPAGGVTYYHHMVASGS